MRPGQKRGLVRLKKGERAIVQFARPSKREITGKAKAEVRNVH